MRCDQCFYEDRTECHRFPPLKGFPIVRVDSWCGEFKEKEINDASSIKEAAQNDGNSGTSTREVICSKQRSGKDSGDGFEEICFNSREGTPKEEEKTVKRRGWPKGKPRK